MLFQGRIQATRTAELGDFLAKRPLGAARAPPKIAHLHASHPERDTEAESCGASPRPQTRLGIRSPPSALCSFPWPPFPHEGVTTPELVTLPGAFLCAWFTAETVTLRLGAGEQRRQCNLGTCRGPRSQPAPPSAFTRPPRNSDAQDRRASAPRDNIPWPRGDRMNNK